MRPRTKNWLSFLAFILALLLWGYLLSLYPPHEIIARLGVTNGYITAFLASTIGGVSTLFAGTYYATLITFVVGGLDPLMLGVVAGIGATIGDSIFFYLGVRGRALLSGRWALRSERFGGWLGRQRQWAVAATIFLYAGLTPLPKDFLVVALAIARYPYWRMIGPLMLGNICLIVLGGYLTLRGVDVMEQLG